MIDLKVLQTLAKKFTVLYVEDNETLRNNAAKFLQKIFPVVFLAADGVEGLNLFKKHHPSLVITDIMMPNMDGFAMSQEIKNLNPKTEIIIMSAFDDKEKLLYSTFLDNQRLFISFGFDLWKINSIIRQETKISNKNLQKKIVSLVLIISIVTFIFFLLSYFVAQKIEKIFKDYKSKVISNERKYQLLFNHSNDGFIISKITDDKKSQIISTNSLAKKLSGYGVDLIGRDFFKLFVKFDKKTLFETNEILDKVLLITKDKLLRHIELSCVLYKYNNEILLFSSLRDISERIELKAEKERQEKLLIQKSKMASMGEMIGNIAHQWRQPISELSGLFFDIESAYDYGELNKKYLSKRIDEANDVVEYMSKTIDDFREFYNPNSKKEKFYLFDNVVKTISIVHSSFKYHNIKIHCRGR